MNNINLIEAQVSSVGKDDSLEDCPLRKGNLPKRSEVPNLISGPCAEDVTDCHMYVERYRSMRVESYIILLLTDDYAMNAQEDVLFMAFLIFHSCIGIEL